MPLHIALQPGCVIEPPSPQSLVDLVPGWITRLPSGLGVVSGDAELCEDPRTTWAIDRLGGIVGARILELGPLEGAHTHMLLRSGAASVLAIESSKQAYLRCLITKELLKLEKAEFLLGNFVPWLATTRQTFDVVWATGVLDLVLDPLGVLDCIALRTNKVHIFTHFIPDEGPGHADWAKAIVEVQERQHRGRMISHFMRSYPEASTTPRYSGGLYSTGAWLRKADILEELYCLGYKRIETAFESTHLDNGPSIAITAIR